MENHEDGARTSMSEPEVLQFCCLIARILIRITMEEKSHKGEDHNEEQHQIKEKKRLHSLKEITDFQF